MDGQGVGHGGRPSCPDVLIVLTQITDDCVVNGSVNLQINDGQPLLRQYTDVNHDLGLTNAQSDSNCRAVVWTCGGAVHSSVHLFIPPPINPFVHESIHLFIHPSSKTKRWSFGENCFIVVFMIFLDGI